MALFSDLKDRLPPTISRSEIDCRLGGAISAKTLANLDSLGKGPEGRHRVGRKIVYQTDLLLAWLDSRSTKLK